MSTHCNGNKHFIMNNILKCFISQGSAYGQIKGEETQGIDGKINLKKYLD